MLIFRLIRGPDDRKNAEKYVEKAARELIIEAASEAWSVGVPWCEALELATRSVKKVQDLIGPVAKPKAKPKAKAKAHA